MTRFVVFPIVLLMLMGTISGAVSAEDLLTVYSQAQENDPTLQAAKEVLMATKELMPQANANFLPSVTAASQFASSHESRGGHFTTNNYTVTLTQPVFYYQQWVQYAQADAQVKQAYSTYTAAEQALIVRTLTAYFNILKAQDTLYFAKAQRKALAKFLAQTEERYRASLIAITDVEIAKAQFDSALSKEIAAETNLENQKQKLQEITGVYPCSLAVLQGCVALTPPEPSNVELWVDSSIEQNFNLQALRYEIDISKANIKLRSGEHLPTINVVGSVYHNSRIPFVIPKETTSSVGLQMCMPIFSGGSILSKTRQARHLYEHSQRQYEILYRQTESNTRQFYRNVLTQIGLAKALQQAARSNEHALKATDESFKVGNRTIVDVLTSQTNLIQSQQDYAYARYEYILQSIQLKQSAGTLNPCDVQSINAWLACPED